MQRSKGLLGENEPDMMWLTTMNPETRRLIKVMPEDVERTAQVFDLLLGMTSRGARATSRTTATNIWSWRTSRNHLITSGRERPNVRRFHCDVWIFHPVYLLSPAGHHPCTGLTLQFRPSAILRTEASIWSKTAGDLPTTRRRTAVGWPDGWGAL